MSDLNPVLHQSTRLRIMVFLMKSRVAAVTTVRDALRLTDGNLAGHLQRLEEAGYVLSTRRLRALRFEVQTTITPKGSAALLDYVRTLRELTSAVDHSLANEP